jgi:UDP-GlcNAc3NAcA epimerase
VFAIHIHLSYHHFAPYYAICIQREKNNLTDIRAVLVVGARPQFIKSAPIISEIANHRGIKLSVIHSGQHYDPEMSAVFFRELNISKPSTNLHVGSGSHASQTAMMMMRLEEQLMKSKPDLVMVPGDTNTTLAGALTAAKLGIPAAHIEAGLRAGDMSMPEEINRKLTDHCSAILFAPTRTAMANLRKEGLREPFLTGDTMVDVLNKILPVVHDRTLSIIERFGLDNQEYVLVTLHRPSNVDDLERFGDIFHALIEIGRKLRVVFLVHPRTGSRVAKLGTAARSKSNGVALAPPQGYIETLALLSRARCLLTDSGGMQKESFLLHVPCVTLRSTTEWPETLTGGANRLIPQPNMISRVVLEKAYDERLRKTIAQLRNPFGDGRASAKIARIILGWKWRR